MTQLATLCPRCHSGIDVRAGEIACVACKQRYPRLGEIPVLLPEPESFIDSCWQQLALLNAQAEQTVSAIEQQMHAADVLPSTRKRCRAMIDAIRGQASDILAILAGQLPDATPARTVPAELGAVPAPVQYLQHLYRDWGWAAESDGENERALAAVERVLTDRSFGNMLVLGAGGCRLAYDLHRRGTGTETTVVDIDPFVFAVAHPVIRGRTLSIREANSEIDEIAHVEKQWTLAAPAGRLDDDRFHFLLADGLQPPLASETFDTVLTPWFVDVIPSDLRDFTSTVFRLLKQGGRWVNLGPLRYGSEIPITLRFSREEIVDLLARAGFETERSELSSTPYLVSKLNGRGKVESVLAFSATKRDVAPQNPGDRPPAWLLFNHLPIPTFAGQSVFWSKAPMVQLVVSSIDGKRTLEDLTILVAQQARDSGLTLQQIRGAVRRCLSEVHPATM